MSYFPSILDSNELTALSFRKILRKNDDDGQEIDVRELKQLLAIIPFLQRQYESRETFYRSHEGGEIHFGIQERDAGSPAALSDDSRIRNVQRVESYVPLIIEFQKVLDAAFAHPARARVVHVLGDILHELFEASLAFDDDASVSRESDTEAYVFYELKMRVFLKCLEENEPELFLMLIQGGYRVPNSTKVTTIYDRSWLSSSFVQNLEHLPHGMLLSREVDVETLDRMATLEVLIAANAVAMKQFTPGRSRAVHQYVLRHGERPLRPFVRAEAAPYRQRLSRFVLGGELLPALSTLFGQNAGPIPMVTIQRITNYARLVL